MRKILTILFLLPFIVNAQFGQPKFTSTSITPPPPPPGGTVNLTFNPINPNTEFAPRYGGPSRWNTEDGAKIISNLQETCYYFRLTWSDCESSTVQGDYSSLWTGRMRTRVTAALNNGQLFAFGIMQRYPEICAVGGFHTALSYGGACSSYPLYVHNLMQGNANPDWNDFNDGTTWIEAANNPNWQSRWSALHVAIMNWMDTAVIVPSSGPRAGQSINVKTALAYVDIRGCGSYGEWHNCCLDNGYDLICNWPGVSMINDNCFGTIETYGTYATPQTMKNIIDAQVNAYNNYPCVIIINAMDGNRFGNTKISPEVAAYILTKTNAFGPIGFRRDQWGDNADYYHQILEDNNQTYGGVGPFKDSIVTRYRWNYFTGEMPGYNCNNASSVCRNGVNFGWLPSQAQILHPTWVGNGNFGGNAPTNQQSVDSILRFFMLNGPRVLPTGGTMTQTLQNGSQFNVTLAMANNGTAVIHRAWTAQVILKNSGGTTVFTGTHSFTVKGFWPTNGTSLNFSTNFTLSGAVPGTGYSLYLRLVDPLNYAQPFYLGISPRESDGSYLIRSNITVI